MSKFELKMLSEILRFVNQLDGGFFASYYVNALTGTYKLDIEMVQFISDDYDITEWLIWTTNFFHWILSIAISLNWRESCEPNSLIYV